MALLLGAALGVEREFKGHPAGLRTMSAVSLGSCMYALLGTEVAHTDPTRIAAQVVSGIGFLGAGTIIRSGVSIRGLTTAAVIWVAAAIGMSAGFGLFLMPTMATALILMFLVGMKPIEDRIIRSRHRVPETEEEPGA